MTLISEVNDMIFMFQKTKQNFFIANFSNYFVQEFPYLARIFFHHALLSVIDILYILIKKTLHKHILHERQMTNCQVCVTATPCT